MKQILVIGDKESAKYHPLDRVEDGLKAAAEQHGQVTVRTDYHKMTTEELNRYDLVINYIDNFPAVGAFAEVLADWLLHGGRLLVVHNGMINAEGGVLERCYGARFITHPDYTELNYKRRGDADWLEGIPDFRMGEEPYMFLMLDESSQIFMEYEYEGTAYPAGWKRGWGDGQVLYFAPGHDERTSQNPIFCSILSRCIKEILAS